MYSTVQYAFMKPLPCCKPGWARPFLVKITWYVVCQATVVDLLSIKAASVAADELLSPELQLIGQRRASRVTFDEDEVQSQREAPSCQLSTADSVASQTLQLRRLTASDSVLSQIEESPSSRLGADSAEVAQPKGADISSQEAEAAEDDYGDEFEPDEAIADESSEPAADPAFSQNTFNNPLGDDESVQGAEDQDDDADDSTRGHMAPGAASSDVHHLSLPFGKPESESGKVQWSLDVSRPEPEEDAEDDQDDEDEGARSKGRFTKMPSTPHPRRSIFSASGNMADDVDIFSITHSDEESASDGAESELLEPSATEMLQPVSLNTERDSGDRSGVDLTPSYRQLEGRSLQQAADNEQPFATSWRPNAVRAKDADPVSALMADHVPVHINEAIPDLDSQVGALPPSHGLHAPASQTPSRQSSLGNGTVMTAGERQVSLGTAGASVPAKQPSFSKMAPHDTAARLPSQTSLPVQFSLDRLAPGHVMQQPSHVAAPASANSSCRSSFGAKAELQGSQLFGSRQVSIAGMSSGGEKAPGVVSRTASMGGSTHHALGPELSARSLVPSADAQGALEVPSKQSSFSKPAALSRPSSQNRKQYSGSEAAASAVAPSANGARAASRQTSLTNTVLTTQTRQISRDSSTASAAASVVPSAAASRVASRQTSLTQPAMLSRQVSGISRQPSNASMAAAAAATGGLSQGPSRQPSFVRPASASRQNSQLLQSWRSNSLEAMHRQMSMPRRAAAEAQPVPAVLARKLSQDREVGAGLHA